MLETHLYSIGLKKKKRRDKYLPGLFATTLSSIMTFKALLQALTLCGRLIKNFCGQKFAGVKVKDLDISRDF